MKLTSWMTAGLACAALNLGTLRAADTNITATAPERIGVYDSRAIAYAHFWQERQLRKRDEMAKASKEARAAGQTNRYAELMAELTQLREQSHLQVFSTAPVDNVLAEMKDRVAAVQKEAGVTRLVSKWDEETLQGLKGAEKVDVTNLLLREFTLDEKQRKMAADLCAKEPLPLKEAEKMMRDGRL